MDFTSLLYIKSNYNGIDFFVILIAFLRIMCYNKKNSTKRSSEMGFYNEINTPEFSFFHRSSSYPKQVGFNMHIHDNYEILCFLAGNADYMVEGQNYHLRPGCIMLMRSAETHHLLLQSDSTYERYVINFRPEMLINLGIPKELLRPFTDRPLGERNLYLPGEFPDVSPQKLFQKMENEAKIIDPRKSVLFNLISLLTAINVAFEKQPKLNPAKKNYTSDAIIDYINENLLSQLSLQHLSNQFHISPSQINRIFRQSTGTSVHHYILIKRLIAAQELIAKGENAMVASNQCGFNDYSSFYRLYKKHFGVAPTSIKKKIYMWES